MPGRTRSLENWLMEQLADNHAASSYINEIISESPELFASALGDVARARRMANVAREADIPRESLYPMLSDAGNPTLQKLIAILGAVGLRLQVAPVEESVQDQDSTDEDRPAVFDYPPSTILTLAANAEIGVTTRTDISNLEGQFGEGLSFHTDGGFYRHPKGLSDELLEEAAEWTQTTLQTQKAQSINFQIRSSTKESQMTDSLPNTPTTSSWNQLLGI